MTDADLLRLKNETALVVDKLQEIPPEILKRRGDLRRKARYQLHPFFEDAVGELEQALIRQTKGVLELRSKVIISQSEQLNESTRVELIARLADDISDYIKKNNFPLLRDLEENFGDRFESYGLMRTSVVASRLHRISRFLSDHVYGERIPTDLLPASVRRGKNTGGVRH